MLTSVGMRTSGIAVLLLVASASLAHAAPGVFVTVSQQTSIEDNSERAGHVDAIRRTLGSAIDNKHLDITVNKLSVTIVGNQVEIVAELGFVLSTLGDQIQSFGTQTAKLTVPVRRYSPIKVPALRREAIDNALEDLLRKLRPRTTRTATA